MMHAAAYFAGCAMVGASGIALRCALCRLFHVTIHHEEPQP